MKHILIICIFLTILIGCTSEHESTPDDQQLTEVSDHDIVNQAISRLLLPDSTSTDLNLLDEIDGVELIYHSNHPELLSHEGIIQPELFDITVQFSVTFTFQTYTKTIVYPIIVKGRTWTVIDIIEQDLLELNLSVEMVDTDLILPKIGNHGSVISRSSSHPYIVTNLGRYYAPLDAEVIIMTATLHYEGLTRTKSFVLAVKPISDMQKVDMAYEMLLIETHVDDDIVLSKKGYFGVSIEWQSSHPNVINCDGVYQKPIGTVSVVLTARLISNNFMREKIFDLTVVGSDPDLFMLEVFNRLEINHGIEVLFESVELPTVFMGHANITWESSHDHIITQTGIVKQPIHTEDVTLTATIHVLDLETTKSFTYTMIGTSDILSDVPMENLAFRNLELTSPFFVDSKLDLSLGFFDGVMMKNQQLVLQGDQLEGSYLSPIYISDPFHRVNIMWGSITHPNARTLLSIRSLINGQWSPWTLMGDWGYGADNLPPAMTYHSNQPTTHLQYKVTLKRHSVFISSPRLHSVSLNYILVKDDFSYPINTLPKHVHYDVPQLRQADTADSSLWNNICWGTSVSMVLQHLGKLNHLDVPQAYYAPLIRLGTLQYGTSKNDIGATQFGIHVSVLEFQSIDMLIYMLHHYGPIIIGVSKGESSTGKFGPLTFSSGHVTVVVGYTIHDDGKIDIIVNDPAVSWIREPFIGDSSDLLLVWDKGGVIMSNPNRHQAN